MLKSIFLLAFTAVCYGSLIKRQVSVESAVKSAVETEAVILPTPIGNVSDTASGQNITVDALLPPVRDNRPILVDSEYETEAPEKSYTLVFDPVILETPISNILDDVNDDEILPVGAEPINIEDVTPILPDNSAINEDVVVDYASTPEDNTDSVLEKRSFYDTASDAEINAFLMKAISENAQLNSYLKDMDSFATADDSESGNLYSSLYLRDFFSPSR